MESPKKRAHSPPPAGRAVPESSPGSVVWNKAEDTSEGNRETLRNLWQLYEDIVLPLERRSHFSHFAAPPVTPAEFEAKPQVLLVGQYSTGKTSMVRWLTGSDSPHFDIKPQPSTDKFMAVVHGDEEKLIKGNAAAVLPQLPYQGLACLGNSFLSSFQAVVQPSDMLRDITLVDTPGVLSGSKQRLGRSYDFASVVSWMAERADLVLLTFDAHKLDISDEFQEVMEVLRPNADKVRCVLNKADQIDASNLVRVYGALLWNVGKVLRTPEVARVFISSFWDQPYRYTDHQQLFDEDKEAIIQELQTLPRTALLRKIDTFVARVQRVRTHLCIVSHLRDHLPVLPRILPRAAGGGDVRLRHWACRQLPKVFDEVQRLHGVSPGDLPSLETYRARLATFEDFSRLPSWDAMDAARLQQVVDVDVPNLMREVGGVSVVRNPLGYHPNDAAEDRGSWFRCSSRKRQRTQY